MTELSVTGYEKIIFPRGCIFLNNNDILQGLESQLRFLDDVWGQGGAGSAQPAAVLVPLVLRNEAPSLLFTKRTDHLQHHPGQISFPGGRVEEGDTSPAHTALRETEEEIGLHPRHIEVLGALPDFHTGTGFCITPVVALVHPPFELTLDAFEVAEAFEVPLSHFLDPANHQRHKIIHEGREREFHAMPYGDYFIWGATAGILMTLYEALRGSEG